MARLLDLANPVTCGLPGVKHQQRLPGANGAIDLAPSCYQPARLSQQRQRAQKGRAHKGRDIIRQIGGRGNVRLQGTLEYVATRRPLHKRVARGNVRTPAGQPARQIGNHLSVRVGNEADQPRSRVLLARDDAGASIPARARPGVLERAGASVVALASMPVGRGGNVPPARNVLVLDQARSAGCSPNTSSAVGAASASPSASA